MRRVRLFASDVGEAVVDEMRHEGINDPVVALAPVFAGGHQLEVTEKRELMTHGRHREAESVRKISDAKLVVSESVHEAKP